MNSGSQSARKVGREALVLPGREARELENRTVPGEDSPYGEELIIQVKAKGTTKDPG